MDRDVLFGWIDDYLDVASYSDYSPIGLQVEGAPRVTKVALGVSAHLELIEAAAAWGAQAIVVHHGFFWKNEPSVLRGFRKRRIKALLDGDISLGSYHLPLDGHPDVGNNACIADVLGVPRDERTPFGKAGGVPICILGRFTEAVAWPSLREKIVAEYSGDAIMFEHGPAEVTAVGICSGGGAGYYAEARALGAQVFITGEAREPTMAEARETETTFVAAGHYRTERAGIIALGEQLTRRFEVETRFFPFDNPV